MGNADWEITHMDLAFTGRELLFKGINIKFSESFTNFVPLPPISLLPREWSY